MSVIQSNQKYGKDYENSKVPIVTWIKHVSEGIKI